MFGSLSFAEQPFATEGHIPYIFFDGVVDITSDLVIPNIVRERDFTGTASATFAPVITNIVREREIEPYANIAATLVSDQLFRDRELTDNTLDITSDLTADQLFRDRYMNGGEIIVGTEFTSDQLFRDRVMQTCDLGLDSTFSINHLIFTFFIFNLLLEAQSTFEADLAKWANSASFNEEWFSGDSEVNNWEEAVSTTEVWR